jgi:hypothetical protein
MKHPLPFRRHTAALLILALSPAACAKGESAAPPSMEREMPEVPAAPAAGGAARQASASGNLGAPTTPAATTRKIIRNGELGLSVDAPEEAQRKATALIEEKGGFVVTSDTRRYGHGEDQSVSVTMVVRVPAERFSETLDALRKLSSAVDQEKVTGQDVTEEYLDLEARIRTQKAVEAQFLDLMKETKTVAEALDVRKHLGEVRGEIEKLEGRRRFLENQSSLSTITVTFHRPNLTAAEAPVNLAGTIRQAGQDAVSVSKGIVIGSIRAAGYLAPLAIFFGIPLTLLAFYLRRRLAAQATPSAR